MYVYDHFLLPNMIELQNKTNEVLQNKYTYIMSLEKLYSHCWASKHIPIVTIFILHFEDLTFSNYELKLFKGTACIILTYIFVLDSIGR